MSLDSLAKPIVENVVLQYLRKTNRPYNASILFLLSAHFSLFIISCPIVLAMSLIFTLADVHTNLNGTLTKASVTKALDKLTAKQLAFSKTYGKTVIYSVAQVSF